MPANLANQTPNRQAARKRPGDQTGREKEKLVLANQDEIAAAAEAMTMADQAKAAANSEVVDYTDEGRVKPEPVLVPEVPVKPQKHKIRVVSGIEDMTFGREIIEPARVGEDGAVRDALLGGLKYYTFEEGREYMVEHDMYVHLVELGYVYE